ncbi:MAG: TlyA family RNA methyltransferase [Chloroflexi bacterium]|nr:TlyA family RNA methyltransferase [Chloroflexota bacterium]
MGRSDDSGAQVSRGRGRRVRLDVALVERGLETSRERARRLIMAGEVTVNGEVAKAPSQLVPLDADLAIGKAMPYVGRGGLKLAHALDRIGIDVVGRVCLDAGASTGGFTDALLRRGAARVYAVDVGRGLLAWSLRQDPRVVVMEGVNVRHLRLASRAKGQRPGDEDDGRARGREGARATEGEDADGKLAPSASRPPALAGGEARGGEVVELPEPVELATVDVAFISLRLVLPVIAGVLTETGEVVALVKPQFEAGKADADRGGGVIRDPAVHRRVLREVMAGAHACGLWPAGLTASPIRGQAGNVEFLLWAKRKRPPKEFDEEGAIAAALEEAPQ